MEVEEQIAQFRELFNGLIDEIGKVIAGQRKIIEGVLICLLSDGHALLEGVPGLGKTMLVRTLTQACDLTFSRIQFTPDLMPADITGTNMIQEDERGHKRFVFQRGPVFANIVLADEINRATPKTQSALLEAMQEKSVTVAKETYKLERPFLVLATQNPLEMEGTYPLPEAQLDRFFFKLMIRFPNRKELHQIMDRTTQLEEPQASKIIDRAQIMTMRTMIRNVPVAPHVQDYALRILEATHPESESAPNISKRYIRYGSSPRGAQAMLLGAKIKAVISGRYNVSAEDIRYVARPALRHRIILNFEGEAEGVQTDAVIDDILKEVPEISEQS